MTKIHAGAVACKRKKNFLILRQMPSSVRHPYIIAQFSALLTVAALACVFPRVPVGASVLCAVVVWLLVRMVARLLGQDSRAELWLLLGAGLLAEIMLLWGVNMFYGPTGEVVLLNNDAAFSYTQILETVREHSVMYDGFFSRQFYGRSMGAIALVLGSVHLIPLLSVSLLCMLLCGIFTARLTRKLCDSRHAGFWAMLMIFATPALLASGCILLKDAWVCMATAALVMCLVLMQGSESRPRVILKWLLGLIFAAGLLMIVRSRALLLLAPLSLLFALPLRGRASAVFAAVAVLLFCIGWTGEHIVACVEAPLDYIDPGVDTGSPRTNALTGFIDSYWAQPLWKRALYLPLSLTLQLFAPLPWTAMRHWAYGPSQVYAHLGLPLYLEAGLVVFFVFFCLRRAPRQLLVTVLWGVLLYVAVALQTAGSVSRYALMLLPLMLPGAAWVIRHRADYKPLLGRWMTGWTAAVIITLLIGFLIYSRQEMVADTLC